MDVEKTIEQMLAVQAKMQADREKEGALHAAFRAEFWSNMADLHKAHADAMKRMDEAMKRMDRADERMDRADARMDRFDKQLLATKKLLDGGIKFVAKLAVRQTADRKKQEADRKDFDRRIKALMQAVERMVHPGPNGR